MPSLLTKSDLRKFSSSHSGESIVANSSPDKSIGLAVIEALREIPESIKSKEAINRLDDTSNQNEIDDIKDQKPYSDYKEQPLRADGFQALAFRSSFDLVSFYAPHINSGTTTLHKWQCDCNNDLSYAHPTDKKPLRYSLCACNGSGKDAFVIAPFAIFFALCKVKSRCIITSSSGVQLTSQTENYIRNLANDVNNHHGEQIFKINQRHIYCRLTGSEIRLFVTDEEGKAEGYHPIEPGCEMCIILNEAKSIMPMIFRALSRCTGYNYWIEVSTPAGRSGDFFKHFYSPFFKTRHVTTFDCPHLSPEEREKDKLEYGENSAIYKSKHLALFSSLDTGSIITSEAIDKCRALSLERKISWKYKDTIGKRYGIDLAAGGDENVVIEIWGNRITKLFAFREKDTNIGADRIHNKLIEWEVPLDYENIFADDGGIGRGIIYNLQHLGRSSIKRILNQSGASNKKEFLNRGAENWYRVKRIIESCAFCLDYDDGLFYNQLESRNQSQQETQGRIALESKALARAEGRPSPDRADAFVLALTGLTIHDFIEEQITQVASIDAQDHETVFRLAEEKKYAEYEEAINGSAEKTNFNGSLNSLLNKQINLRSTNRMELAL